MELNVLKFGGSCVGTADGLEAVARLVDRSARQRGTVVVVSALRGVTDDLERAAAAAGPRVAERIVGRLRDRHCEALDGIGAGRAARAAYLRLVDRRIDELRSHLEVHAAGGSPDTRDAILATGERLAAPLVAIACAAAGRAAAAVDGSDVLETDDRFGSARPDPVASESRFWKRVYMDRVFSGVVPIVTGFIGRSRDGRTTTLGRNGSDLSAAVLASMARARRLVFFKDVDGILQADPRLVDDPGVVPELTFDEALDLASIGVQAIHPLALGAIRATDTRIEFRNAFNPCHPGTSIRRDGSGAPASIKSVVATDRVRLVTAEFGDPARASRPGAFPRALAAAARVDPSVVTIGGGGPERTATFLTRASRADAVARALEASGADPIPDVPLPVIAAAIVGDGVRRDPGVASRALDALRGDGRFVLAMTRSAHSCALRFVVEGITAREAAAALYPLTA